MIHTEVTAFLPTITQGFFISKFRSDKINELNHGKHRLYLQILSKFFEDHIEIKKGQRLGFFCRWTRQSKVLTCTNEKLRQTKRKRKVIFWIQKIQTGGFLNLFNFAYAGRDVVNQGAKVALGVIKGGINDINNIEK